MKTVFKLIAIVVCILLVLALEKTLTSNDTKYSANYSELKFQSLLPGMTQTKVLELIGEPLETRVYPDRAFWYYARQGEDKRANYYIRTAVFNEKGLLVRTASRFEID